MARPSERWIAAIAIPVALSLLAATTAWSLHPREVFHSDLLADDGAHASARLNGNPGQLEHYLGTPGALQGSGLTGVILSTYRPDGWLSAARVQQVLARSESESVEVVLETSGTELSLAAVSSGTTAFVADPAITLSDDRTDALDRWPADGWIGVTDQLASDVTGEARRTDDGDCHTWEIALTPSESDVEVQEFALDLCRGRGLQRLVHRVGSETVIDLEVTGASEPARYAGNRTALDIPASVEQWQPERVPFAATDGFGTESVNVYGPAAPAITRSGLVVVPSLFGHTLTAARIPEAHESVAEVAWRAHPGGSLLGVVTVGDLVVVSTSQRELVAYDDSGMQLWRIRLGDVATALDVAGERIVADLASGTVVAVDPEEGATQWQNRMPGRSAGVLDATDELVSTTDDQGTIEVIEAATGDSLWRSSGLEGTARGAVSERYFAGLRTTRLEVRDVDSGATVFTDTLPGMHADQLATTGDLVVYGSSETTRVADPATGRVRDLPPVDQVRAVGSSVILVDGAQAQLVGPDGTVGPAWDLGGALESSDNCHCALGPDGLVVNLWADLVVIR